MLRRRRRSSLGCQYRSLSVTCRSIPGSRSRSGRTRRCVPPTSVLPSLACPQLERRFSGRLPYLSRDADATACSSRLRSLSSSSRSCSRSVSHPLIPQRRKPSSRCLTSRQHPLHPRLPLSTLYCLARRLPPLPRGRAATRSRSRPKRASAVSGTCSSECHWHCSPRPFLLLGCGGGGGTWNDDDVNVHASNPPCPSARFHQAPPPEAVLICPFHYSSRSIKSSTSAVNRASLPPLPTPSNLSPSQSPLLDPLTADNFRHRSSSPSPSLPVPLGDRAVVNQLPDLPSFPIPSSSPRRVYSESYAVVPSRASLIGLTTTVADELSSGGSGLSPRPSTPAAVPDWLLTDPAESPSRCSIASGARNRSGSVKSLGRKDKEAAGKRAGVLAEKERERLTLESEEVRMKVFIEQFDFVHFSTASLSVASSLSHMRKLIDLRFAFF